MTSRPLSVVVLGAGWPASRRRLPWPARVTGSTRGTRRLRCRRAPRRGRLGAQGHLAFPAATRVHAARSQGDARDVPGRLRGADRRRRMDLDLRPKIKGHPEPDDVDLAFLAVRRPLIEWALRRAVAAEEGVTVSGSTRVTGLLASARNGTGATPTVRGIRDDDRHDRCGPRDRRDGAPHTDARMDRGDRRSTDERALDRLLDHLLQPLLPRPRRSDVARRAVSARSAGRPRLRGLHHVPRRQPNVLRVDRDAAVGAGLKALRHPAAFEAAVATMPALNAWTNADMAEPSPTSCRWAVFTTRSARLTMDDGRSPGLIGVGDALVHTDPSLSLGLSFALLHARYVASAVRDHATDLEAIRDAFEAMARPEMEERYAYVAAIDDTRTRHLGGRNDRLQACCGRRLRVLHLRRRWRGIPCRR